MSKKKLLLGDWVGKDVHEQDREFLLALKEFSKEDLSMFVENKSCEDWQVAAILRELKSRD